MAADGHGTAPVAEFRGVSKRFGEVLAADNLNLTIERGEFLSFLGPSGCGKTTALRMLAGFETPTKGEVLIDGESVNALEPYRRPVNMVFQSYALFPHLTVAQNISFGLRQRRPRLRPSAIAEQVERVLGIVRLSGFGNRRIWQMSGGQQQRVALARAIINEPKLLLLDEPLAALDRKLRKEMQIELQDLQRQLGITFVLVTHDQEEALSLSDRVCVMGAGRIVQVGSPRELYDQPKSRYVADFVGTSNFFGGQVEAAADRRATVRLDSGIRLAGQTASPMAVGDAAWVSIRPEQIKLTRSPQDEALEVTVHNRIFLGEHTEYLVRHPTVGDFLVLAPRQSEAAGGPFEHGETAWAQWQTGAAIILEQDSIHPKVNRET
ncbi:MAG: ABC transporter ATP-binding protein [Candidatus Competibacterales bacterium]